MTSVVGMFRSREDAHRAVEELRGEGFADDQLNVLLPGRAETEIEPGAGKAVGGVVGAAVGTAGGFSLGMAASVLVPGVGPVLAAGLAAAAVFGTAGGLSGAAAGAALDRTARTGLPEDEIFFYEEALRQGRSVVIVLAEDGEQVGKARVALAGAGAESLDGAREAWWIGLRSGEEEHYRATGGRFEEDETAYRMGFEAALRRECRGKPYERAAEHLKQEYPESWHSLAFSRGYERGRAYQEARCAGADARKGT